MRDQLVLLLVGDQNKQGVSDYGVYSDPTTQAAPTDAGNAWAHMGGTTSSLSGAQEPRRVIVEMMLEESAEQSPQSGACPRMLSFWGLRSRQTPSFVAHHVDPCFNEHLLDVAGWIMHNERDNYESRNLILLAQVPELGEKNRLKWPELAHCIEMRYTRYFPRIGVHHLWADNYLKTYFLAFPAGADSWVHGGKGDAEKQGVMVRVFKHIHSFANMTGPDAVPNVTLPPFDGAKAGQDSKWEKLIDEMIER